MVQDCEGGSDVVHYADEVGFAPAAVTGDEAGERLVEAYLVPPLVNVQTTNSDAVFASQVAIDGAAAGSVNQSDGLASSAAKRSSGGFKDLWAALLFLINVAAVIYLAVQSYYAQKEGVTSPAAIDLDDDTLSSMEALLVFTISLTTFASLLGSAFIAFMMNHSSSIISLMLYLNIGVLAFTSACCLITFNIIGAAIFFALAAVSYCYLLSVQSRIPFASAVLSIASDVIKKNYSGLILTAYMSLAVQIVWFILWSAAFIGVFQLMSTDGSAQAGEERRNRGSRSEGDDAVGDEVAANGWLVFVMVLSLYWGVQTIASVLKTTVCGTLACWWFQPNRIAPVRGSLFRSLTTSFGSICFGSLIVAVVQALREMAHMARNSARRRSNRNNEQAAAMIQLCVFCVLECLLKYLERALEYFNRYAFCYVAAYGLSFLESGKQVTGMFTRRYESTNVLLHLLFFCQSPLFLLFLLIITVMFLFYGYYILLHSQGLDSHHQ